MEKSESVESQRVSVFVPVHRESPQLEDLLVELLKDSYSNREIFVVVDEPTERSLAVAKRFEGSANFVLNEQRSGKVNTLNRAVSLAEGDIYLFMDADIKIFGNPRSFLRPIVDAAKSKDLVQPKQVMTGKGVLTRIARYDDIGFNFTYAAFSRLLGKCPGVSGPSFAITREAFHEIGGFHKVIQEDFDLGIRALLKGKSFYYAGDVEVQVQTPSSLADWFMQRKRWAIGAALCLRDHSRELLAIAAKSPQVVLPMLFFMFPSVALLLLSLMVPDPMLEKTLVALLMLVSTKFGLLLPVVTFTSIGLMLARNLVLVLLNFAVAAVLFYILAKKLRLRFQLPEFAAYFFLYSPLWFLIVLVGLIRVTILGKSDVEGWKT